MWGGGIINYFSKRKCRIWGSLLTEEVTMKTRQTGSPGEMIGLSSTGASSWVAACSGLPGTVQFLACRTCIRPGQASAR